jgi:predicted MFS family arabinose efflux permease
MTQTSQTSQTIQRGPGLLLVILCGVQFVDAIDIALMGPAVPRIQADLHMAPAVLQWVVSAYVLGYGGFLLLGGRLADLFNRKRILIGAMVAFVVVSIIGGVAENGSVLIGARLAKGIAAAFTAPASLAILLHSYQDETKRNKALGTYLAIAAIGFTLGLVLGGVLAAITWRLTMFFPALVGIILVIGVAAVVPRSDGSATGDRPRVDLLGAVTVTAGLLLLVYAASNAATAGWASPLTLGSLLASIALIVLFVLIERVREAPLVPLDIFRRPGLSRANIVVFLLQGDYIGWQFVMTLYLQNELHWSPILVGLAFVPGGVMIILTAERWAGLVQRVGAWRLCAFGLLLQSAGFLWSVLVLGHVSGWLLVALPITVMGTGFAAAYPAMNITAVGSARPNEQGLASGLFIAAFQIGSGVVLGIVASVLAINAAAGAGIGAYRAGTLVAFGVAILSLLVALAGVVQARRPAQESSQGLA